ncbi:hypothetical protein AB833_23740 [Chromatiales bacterium (ex Bugula neritina AB1)]|nr:hypothetical protein AB833_23740 [Chromatiales bacterium (ex Bugula neritina AB1)]
MQSRRGSDVQRAAAAVHSGALIAYATEGVFGLGCDPLNSTALQQLLDLKQRDAGKGLIVIASNRQQLEPLVGPVSANIEAKLNASWPGPVTWILPCRTDKVPAQLTGNFNTIATRVTAHPITAALCDACDHALVSTSANISGRPACTTADQVAQCFANDLAYILDPPVGNLTGPTPIFDGATGLQLR